MGKEKIILVGGGGHCKSCIDVIEKESKYEIAGIIDVPEKIGQSILGYQIIASDDDLEKLSRKYSNFLITVGQIESPALRIKLFNKLIKLNVNFPIIKSPFSYISRHAKIEKGTIIMHHVIVNASAHIGQNCIINNKALIEHDAVIRNHCHISTASVINGDCRIGDRCLIGSLTVVKNGIEIASNTIIGAGAVVTKNITDSGIYMGNPAKRIK